MHAFISPFGQVSLCATELSKEIGALIDRRRMTGRSCFFIDGSKETNQTSRPLDVKLDQWLFRMDRKKLGGRACFGSGASQPPKTRAASRCAPDTALALRSPVRSRELNASVQT